MNKTLVTFALVCFYAPVAVIACSSSSSSGGSGSVSSIDSTKQAQSLTDAEKTQYCKDVNAYLAAQATEADTKKVSCFSAAFSSIYLGGTPPKTDAELQTKCKAAYDDCLSKPLSKGDAGATSDPCADVSKEYANCTATVAELNACVQDSAAAEKAAFAQYDTACSKAQLDGGGLDQQSDSTQPASCKTVRTKCPGLK